MKRYGVQVKEYSIGIGPKVVTLYRDKQGIEYNLRGILMLGYVNDEKVKNIKKGKNTIQYQSLFKQTLIFSAGIIMNFILAFMLIGLSTNILDYPVSIMEKGEKKFDENNEINKNLKSIYNNSESILSISSKKELEEFKNKGYINEYSKKQTISKGDRKASIYNINTTFKGIGKELKEQIDLHFNFFAYIFSPTTFEKFNEKLKLILSPVGLGKKIDNSSEKMNWAIFLFIMGLLNISILIINIIPLPALDGGQVLKAFLGNLFYRINNLINKTKKIRHKFLINFENKFGYIENVVFVLLITLSISLILRDAIFL